MISKARSTIGYRMSDTSLGEELQKRRGTRSLSEISRATGISVATLSRIEANKIATPSRETLHAIAHEYGMPVEILAQLVYCGAHRRSPNPVAVPA